MATCTLLSSYNQHETWTIGQCMHLQCHEKLHTFTGWFTCVYKHNFSLSIVQIQSNRYQLIRRTEKHFALSQMRFHCLCPDIHPLYNPVVSHLFYKHNATIATYLAHHATENILYAFRTYWIKHTVCTFDVQMIFVFLCLATIWENESGWDVGLARLTRAV